MESTWCVCRDKHTFNYVWPYNTRNIVITGYLFTRLIYDVISDVSTYQSSPEAQFYLAIAEFVGAFFVNKILSLVALLSFLIRLCGEVWFYQF